MHDIDQTPQNEQSAPRETPLPEPSPDPAKSGAVAGQDTAKPYGLLGLCLSLVLCVVIAELYAAIAGTVAVIVDGLIFGWEHPADFLNQFENRLAAGDTTVFLRFTLSLSLVVYLALILAVLTLARFRGSRGWRALIGWQPWSILRTSRTFWFIVAGGLIYVLAANLLVGTLYPPSKDWFTVPEDRMSAVLLFALAVVFAPLTEEIVFRGWIYTSLRASFGCWAALLTTSVFFAAAHYESTHIYALVVFPIGLTLGALRETTGSLKAPICFHAFCNAVAYALAVFDIG